MGKSRGSGGRGGIGRGPLDGPRVRPGLRLVIACGLLGLLSLPIALPPWRLDGTPQPSPSPPRTAR